MTDLPEQRKPSAQQVLGAGPAAWIATGLGFGLSPFAPGTVGAVWGIPLALALQALPNAWLQSGAIAAICLAGVPICTSAARRLGGLKDPGCIVLDEIASLPITYFLVDVGHWPVMLAGFLLHRVFDILKPAPARQLERLPEGLGIMADDWMAGVYSNIALQALLWIDPGGLFTR